MKIQINMPENTNVKVEYYQVAKGLKTKEEAIVQMLDSHPFNIQVEGLAKTTKQNKKVG